MMAVHLSGFAIGGIHCRFKLDSRKEHVTPCQPMGAVREPVARKSARRRDGRNIIDANEACTRPVERVILPCEDNKIAVGTPEIAEALDVSRIRKVDPASALRVYPQHATRPAEIMPDGGPNRVAAGSGWRCNHVTVIPSRREGLSVEVKQIRPGGEGPLQLPVGIEI